MLITLDRGLQNPGLIRELFERYYRGGVRASDMSSHWQLFSEQFRVTLDPRGQLATIDGFGFGELRWRGHLHRLAHRASITSHLLHLPQRRRLRALLPLLTRMCRAMDLHPTLDAFRQLCTLELLERHIPEHLDRGPRRFLMIGDGYGLLAALVKSRWPDAQLVMIDLGQSLLFQAVYCQKAHPQATHATAGSTDAANADFVYCASDRRRAIEAMTFDVAVNVASMQEMDPATVSGYFDFLRGHMMPANLFYCCNRESKSLPDGQVSAFAAYPWRPTDQVHLDGPCPWHQYYLTPRWTGRSPRILGLPLLGVSGYDGIHLHRLVTLGGE